MKPRPAIELSETLPKQLQRRIRDCRYLALASVSSMLMPDDRRSLFDGLTTFCCFVGHGRSGGTLVGALLNAHPNIVMANELNALRRLATGLTAEQLYRVIYLVSERQVRRGSRGGGGYSYAVPNQWQGRHQTLTVIGDRKAGATAYEIVTRPSVLTILKRKVHLEKKFVHVVRHPLDTIATTFQKTRAKSGESPSEHLTREIRNYFGRSSAVGLIQNEFGPGSVLHVFHERLLDDPVTTLGSIGAFLNAECRPDYLRDCASIIMDRPHETRWSVPWSESDLELIRERAASCSWLNGYDLSFRPELR